MPEPSVGQLVSSDRILAWHDTLVGGGGVTQGDDRYEQAVVLAIVRWMNGLGPDPTDSEYGLRAHANVQAVLG